MKVARLHLFQPPGEKIWTAWSFCFHIWDERETPERHKKHTKTATHSIFFKYICFNGSKKSFWGTKKPQSTYPPPSLTFPSFLSLTHILTHAHAHTDMPPTPTHGVLCNGWCLITTDIVETVHCEINHDTGVSFWYFSPSVLSLYQLAQPN